MRVAPPPFIHFCLVEYRGGTGPATLVQRTVRQQRCALVLQRSVADNAFHTGNTECTSALHTSRQTRAWCRLVTQRAIQPATPAVKIRTRRASPVRGGPDPAQATMRRPRPASARQTTVTPTGGDPGQLEQLFSAPDLIALDTARQEGQLDLCSTCLGRAGLALDHRREGISEG